MKRGRPKGYSAYIDISYEELADYVGRKTLVKVCRTWLDDLVKQTRKDCEDLVENDFINVQEKAEEPKIEYQITNFDDDE